MRGTRAVAAIAIVGIGSAAWGQDSPSPAAPTSPPAATPAPDARPAPPAPATPAVPAPPPTAAVPPSPPESRPRALPPAAEAPPPPNTPRGRSAAGPRTDGPDRRGPPRSSGQAPAAPSTSIKRVTPEAMAEILRDAGYRAQIVNNPGKKPFIRTGMSSRRVTVNFYDCKDEGCQSIQYRVVFNKSPKLSIGFANAWNLKKRFAKAYVDGDGEMSFEWDVDLDGGVSSAYITQTALTFDDLIGLFDAFEP